MSETLFGKDEGLVKDAIDTTVDVSGGYAVVALERGGYASGSLGEGLTYAIGKDLADLAVGERVEVPLGRGNQKVWGYVTGLTDEVPVNAKGKVVRCKNVIARDEGRIRLTGDLIELGKWIGHYYCSPVGMALAGMLPAAVKQRTGTKQVMMVRLPKSENGEPVEEPKITKLQKAIMEAAAGRDWTELRELADLAGAKTKGPVKKLVAMGLLETRSQAQVRGRGVMDFEKTVKEGDEVDVRFELSAEQKVAVEKIQSGDDGFGVSLLHGVTGSGKTEVYLRLIEDLLAKDKSAGIVVLVPEIALTPQTVGRFVRRFNRDDEPCVANQGTESAGNDTQQGGVAVLHSGLTSAQRHAQWRRIFNGEANIVVGARSAIFAPVKKLKLIIVDEEHEGSYKQDQLPRYHARDVAVKRGQVCGARVVLGSATPSLESYFNATRRKVYDLVQLTQRVPGMKLPRVKVVDMIEARRERKGVHLLSMELEGAMARVLQGGGQTMLFLNRRGYANYIACPDQNCGWMMKCRYCDAMMVYHKDASLPMGGQVRCHHCSAEQVLPRLCPDCRKKVTVFGLGTQRVEEELERKFSGARVLRMDSDTMRKGADYQEVLDVFRRGEAEILLGTQMIAKGLDFPNVRLVGVVSGDTALNMPDFRAGERTFGLIAQVSGRAGRSDKPGEVYVQTFNAEDEIINLAAAHDYVGFAERELKLREEAGHPPSTRMVRIVVRDRDRGKCEGLSNQLLDKLRAMNDRMGLGVMMRGPVPCSIDRIAEFFRFEIELMASGPAMLQKLMGAMRGERELISDGQVAVDVDPIVMM